MEREQVIQELEQIASPSTTQLNDGAEDISIANVVLVFDGEHYETLQKSVPSPWFQVVITDGKDRKRDRADDYIINHALPELQTVLDGDEKERRHVIHLVSADKGLRKRAMATRKMNGGSVVPSPKFWRNYLPNLQQKLKSANN